MILDIQESYFKSADVVDTPLDLAASAHLHVSTSDTDDFEVHFSSPISTQDMTASSYIGLPAPSPENIDEIRDKLSTAFASQKEMYANIILEQVLALPITQYATMLEYSYSHWCDVSVWFVLQREEHICLSCFVFLRVIGGQLRKQIHFFPTAEKGTVMSIK